MVRHRGVITAPLTHQAYIGVETYAPMRASFGSMDRQDHILAGNTGFLFSAGLNLYAIVRVLPEVSQRYNIVKAAVRDEHGALIAGERLYTDPHEIEHPYVRAAMLYHQMQYLQVDLQGSVSARMGLGGSSAMMAALLVAMWHWKHRGRIAIDPIDLIRDVSYLELGPKSNGFSLEESHGVQDVVGSVGFNLTGSPLVAMPIVPDTTRAYGHEWTWTRPLWEEAVPFGSNVLGWLDSRLLFCMIRAREEDAGERIAGHSPTETHHRDLARSAEAAALALSESRYDDFTAHVRESWATKLDLDPNVVPASALPFYHGALEAGAHVVRVMGAGNGGFFMIIAEPEIHGDMRALAAQSDTVWFCPDATIAEAGVGVQNFKPSRG